MKSMDWWKNNGPSILKVNANKYDNLSKTWKDLFKRGGEIGLYENTDGGSWYASVDGKEEIRTSQRIYDNKGNTLLENDVSSYTKEGKHFWNLAIRSDAGYNKNDLHQESILYIDDAEYREKLRK